jgi:hypothetical protein
VHDASFPDGQEDWFEQLSELEPGAASVLIEVLALVASADGVFTTPERRFLQRLARTLKRDIDLGTIERMVVRMRAGEAVEPAELSLRPPPTVA